MRHVLSFDEGEFGEEVIEQLNHAWRDRLPVRVSLRDACEPQELNGLVERIAATAAFIVINGYEVPLPAIQAVDVWSLVVPDHHRCTPPKRRRFRGRSRCA